MNLPPGRLLTDASQPGCWRSDEMAQNARKSFANDPLPSIVGYLCDVPLLIAFPEPFKAVRNESASRKAVNRWYIDRVAGEAMKWTKMHENPLLMTRYRQLLDTYVTSTYQLHFQIRSKHSEMNPPARRLLTDASQPGWWGSDRMDQLSSKCFADEPPTTANC
jgi:hypothetical protein